MPQHTLIIGGAKSGKSALALELARKQGGRLVFIATAQAHDQEMARRIARHQAERGPEWTTREEPLELEAALRETDAPGAVLLVDCLTLWLSNLLTGAGLEPEQVAQRGRGLARLLPGLQARVILVGNEVGLGIVPQHPLARSFRDLSGGLHQELARVCQRVVFCAAGLPLVLKGPAL